MCPPRVQTPPPLHVQLHHSSSHSLRQRLRAGAAVEDMVEDDTDMVENISEMENTLKEQKVEDNAGDRLSV